MKILKENIFSIFT